MEDNHSNTGSGKFLWRQIKTPPLEMGHPRATTRDFSSIRKGGGGERGVGSKRTGGTMMAKEIM